MTRIAQTRGSLWNIGPLPLGTYFSYAALMEASPIYQSMTISLRIWGTRTKTVTGVVTTQTIDQTETLIIPRIDPPSGAPLGIGQVAASPSPGDMALGGIAVFGVSGLPDGCEVSAAIAYDYTPVADGVFRLGWSEVEYNTRGSPYTPLFDSNFTGLPGLPDPKRQRLVVSGGENRDFSFDQTVTPPGTSSTVIESRPLDPPFWGGLSAIPAGNRGGRFGWGYSASECIDTSAWTAAQWRDYRGVWAMPAIPELTGWDSGDMQRQYTVTIA